MTSLQRPPAPAPGPPAVPLGDVAELVRSNQGPVWRYLRLCGADAHEAEDLLQETFVQFALSSPPVAEVRSAAGYLCGIARNLLLAARRRQRREPPAADWLAEVDRLAADDPMAFADARVAALRECMQRLTERARRALEWRHLDGLPRAEVAVRLGLGDEGAKSLLERSRETLRECVQRRTKEEAP